MKSFFSNKDHKHIAEYGKKVSDELRLKNLTISIYELNNEYFIVAKINSILFFSKTIVFGANNFIDVNSQSLNNIQAWIDKTRNNINL